MPLTQAAPSVVGVRRRGAVVGGVRDLVLGLPARLLVAVVVPVQVQAVAPVRVRVRTRRRRVAEQVVQQPPETPHRNGLYRRSWPIVLTGP